MLFGNLNRDMTILNMERAFTGQDTVNYGI